MQGYIIDLDGTLYRGNTLIAYASDFIHMLQANDFPYLLMTNNSTRTNTDIADHLIRMGIRITPEYIYTSAQASAEYMKHLHKGQVVYCIGEDGLKDALKEQGFIVIEEHDELQIPDYVVQGLDRQLHYNQIRKAVNYIRGGAVFINTNPDRLFPSEDTLHPGAGTIAASIQYATQVEPVMIGKPSPIMITCAIRHLGVPRQDVWMIGDNLATDIQGGAGVGCKTALVLTGLATKENVQDQINETSIHPDLICRNLREFAIAIGYPL